MTVVGVVAVDDQGAALNTGGDAHGLGQILGEHGTGQTVLGGVGDGEGLLLGVEGDDGEHGSKDLHVSGDVHVGGDVVQQGGGEERAVTGAAVL